MMSSFGSPRWTKRRIPSEHESGVDCKSHGLKIGSQPRVCLQRLSRPGEGGWVAAGNGLSKAYAREHEHSKKQKSCRHRESNIAAGGQKVCRIPESNRGLGIARRLTLIVSYETLALTD